MPIQEMTNAEQVRNIVKESPVNCRRCAKLRVRYSDAVKSTASAEAILKALVAENSAEESVGWQQNAVALRAKIEATVARRLISHTLTCKETVKEVLS